MKLSRLLLPLLHDFVKSLRFSQRFASLFEFAICVWLLLDRSIFERFAHSRTILRSSREMENEVVLLRFARSSSLLYQGIFVVEILKF